MAEQLPLGGRRPGKGRNEAQLDRTIRAWREVGAVGDRDLSVITALRSLARRMDRLERGDLQSSYAMAAVSREYREWHQVITARLTAPDPLDDLLSGLSNPQ